MGHFVRGHIYGDGVQPLDTAGKFWALGDDNRRVDGTLNWKPGADAELRLQSRVIDSLASPVTLTANGYMVKSSVAADRVVADRVPRVLLGDTAAGLVTGVDSYMRGGFGLAQVWDLQTLVVGAHFTAGNSTGVEAIRFILDGPDWWAHLPDRGAATDDAGVILCERTTDDLMQFEVHPTFAMTLRSAQRAVLSVMTLMKLAVGVDLRPLHVQVREPGQTRWLDVKTRELDPSKVSWPEPGNLFPRVQ